MCKLNEISNNSNIKFAYSSNDGWHKDVAAWLTNIVNK